VTNLLGGIAQNLKSALGQYSSGDREQVGIYAVGFWRLTVKIQMRSAREFT